MFALHHDNAKSLWNYFLTRTKWCHNPHHRLFKFEALHLNTHTIKLVNYQNFATKHQVKNAEIPFFILAKLEYHNLNLQCG